MWSRLKSAWTRSTVWVGSLARKPPSPELRREWIERAPVPVFWLFGKTGSGKSSIVRWLTRNPTAEIGSGFQPQTKTSSEYVFPSAEEPVLRFLDTRGLGEAHYDPTEDLAAFNERAHLVIVTVRLMDQALAEIVEGLRTIRAAQPSRPVLLVLTCLHEAYPGQPHPAVDPWASDPPNWPAELPHLARAWQQQLERFAGLVDRVIAIDFTPPDDGFVPADLGGGRLEVALQQSLPLALRQTLIQWREASKALRESLERETLPYILGYATLAASAAAVPVPWVDIPVVLGLQSHLILKLAGLYGQPQSAALLTKVAGAIGSQLLLRLAARSTLKLIPVAGEVANAAMAFVYTYSLGLACQWYFGQLQQGHIPDQAALNDAWSSRLDRAWQIWSTARGEAASPPAGETAKTHS